MPYIYESGKQIPLGSHGDSDYVYASGEPVPNTGISEYVFESGIGIGGAGDIIDDFEDGDLNGWTDSVSNGTVVTSPVPPGIGGTYALEVYTPGNARELQSMPGDGLSSYPEPGDTIRWYSRTDNLWSNHRTHIGDIDSNVHYTLQVDYDGGQIQLKGDNVGIFESTNISGYNANTWHLAEFDWQENGDITASVYSIDANGNADTLLDSVSGNDTTITSTTGIQLESNSGSGDPLNNYWDHIHKVA